MAHRVRLIVFSLIVAAGTSISDAWYTCGGLEHDISHTACPNATATCCKQGWVPSTGTWGCCPYPEAVCCSNGYTCCPKGTTCRDSGRGWSTTTTCIDAKARAIPPGADGGGQQVCKTGGPLPFSTTKKNVIILGDSVSIGYTPNVAAIMNDTALVQHSPWGGDGGAEETRYGWKCLDYLLRAPDSTPQRPDVLYFNFGLHNLNNDNTPGQAGPIAEYAPYLEKIAARLAALRPATTVLFGITTPWMCNKSTDDVIVSNNKAAVNIMAKHNIPTVDLHAALVGQCGPIPNQNCFGQHTCFCPHCPQANGIGYQWLAQHVIVPFIQKALREREQVVV